MALEVEVVPRLRAEDDEEAEQKPKERHATPEKSPARDETPQRTRSTTKNIVGMFKSSVLNESVNARPLRAHVHSVEFEHSMGQFCKTLVVSLQSTTSLLGSAQPDTSTNAGRSTGGASACGGGRASGGSCRVCGRVAR